MSPATSIRSRARLALGLGVLSLALVSCGGGDGTSPTGGINIAPNTISFTTAPGGTLDPKSVGITPATVDLTGLTATTVFVGTPPSEWLATSLSKSDALARESSHPRRCRSPTPTCRREPIAPQ